VIVNENLYEAIAESINKWVGERTWIEPQETVEDVALVPEKRDGPPVVQIVTIRLGDECFQLQSPDCVPFVIPYDLTKFFAEFVNKVDCDAPGEIVPWRRLNATLRLPGEEECDDSKRGIAIEVTRKAKNTLNRKLRRWGCPPDGGDWIARSNHGACLNTSCEWRLDESLRALLRGIETRRLIDSRKIGKKTPAKGQRLPSRPVQRKPQSDEDDD
jgi:hypothetical protein